MGSMHVIVTTHACLADQIVCLSPQRLQADERGRGNKENGESLSSGSTVCQLSAAGFFSVQGARLLQLVCNISRLVFLGTGYACKAGK
jgi:hypothetical protein